MCHVIKIITCHLLHTHFLRTEREKYAKHRHKARKNPENHLSIIIDGMDQDKRDIPHIISKQKEMARVQTLETHVIDIRAHSQCTLFTIDSGQFPNDGNLTVENLLQLFHELKVNRTTTSTTSWRKLCDAFIHVYVKPIRFTYMYL